MSKDGFIHEGHEGREGGVGFIPNTEYNGGMSWEVEYTDEFGEW